VRSSARPLAAGARPPPNQALHLTGAAILVLRDTKVLQAAPAGELGCSASEETAVTQQRQTLQPIEVFFPAKWFPRPEKYPRAAWGDAGCTKTPGWLSPTNGMVYLVAFEFDGTDEDLKTLADWANAGRLPTVTAIRLKCLREVTDAGLAHLTAVPDLQELAIDLVLNLTDVGLTAR
jgi:hypothetical protein